MATPRRSTRSRTAAGTPQPEPLDAAQHRTNFSYGTRGPAAPGAQVADEDANFDNAFQSSRESAQPEPATRARRTRTRQQDSTEPESDADRPSTRIGGPYYENGILVSGRPPRPPVPPFSADVPKISSRTNADLAASLTTAPGFQTAGNAPIGTALQDSLSSSLGTASRTQTSAAVPIGTAPQHHPDGSLTATSLAAAPQSHTSGAAPIGTAPAENVEEHQPWYSTILVHAVPRWVKQFSSAHSLLPALLSALILLGALTAGMLTACYLPLGALSPARDNLLGSFKHSLGLPLFDIPPNTTVVSDFLWGQALVPPGVIHAQEAINREFRLHLLTQIEISRGMRHDLALHNDTLNELTRILPSMVAVVERDGILEIPGIFWDALLEKVGSDAASPLWENFLRQNRDWLAKEHENVIDQKLEVLKVTRKLIDRDEFTAELDRNRANMDDWLNKHLDDFRTKLLHDAQRAVEKQATKILESSPAYKIAHAQISTLALTNLLVNIGHAFDDINWFSRATGALVDPRYTSATKNPLKSGTWSQWLYAMVFSIDSPPYPPAMAIQSWAEAGECWCTPVSNGETKAGQLGIKLGHAIQPDRLFIEHIPGRATRDIAAAPKDFEVWAKLNSTAEVERMHDMLSNDSYYYMYPGHHGNPACGKPPRGEPDWLCILRHDYRIHWPNHIQYFQLPFVPTLLFQTDHVVVRALTNWGADHTCFYRVRLIGPEYNADYDVQRTKRKLEDVMTTHYEPNTQPWNTDTHAYHIQTRMVDRYFN